MKTSKKQQEDSAHLTLDPEREVSLSFEMGGDLAALFGAICQAQGDIVGVAKGEVNNFFNSKFATLTSIMQACRKPMTDNGLALIQAPGWDQIAGQPMLTTVVGHKSGGWLRAEASSPMAKGGVGPQGFASVISYLRRYSLVGVMAIPQFDDDGEKSQEIVRRIEAAEAEEENSASPTSPTSPTNGTTDSTLPPPPTEPTEAEVLYSECMLRVKDSTTVEGLNHNDNLVLFENLKSLDTGLYSEFGKAYRAKRKEVK
jgi:hypothetical protein